MIKKIKKTEKGNKAGKWKIMKGGNELKKGSKSGK